MNYEQQFHEIIPRNIPDQSIQTGEARVLSNYSQLKYFPDATLEALVLDQDVLKVEIKNRHELILVGLSLGETEVLISIRSQFGLISTKFTVVVR